MLQRLLCLAIGYGFGLIQTSYIYGRLNGIDIRTKGSGNAGTTNALRTLGFKAGIITLVGDMIKGLLAVLVTTLIFQGSSPELFPLLKIWTGAGVVLGHDFPFYLNFKGGKGIAATAGMLAGFGDMRLLAICIITFLILFNLTHYVSLCSMSMYVAFLIFMIVFGCMGHYGMTTPRLIEMYIIVLLLTILAFWGHRENIKRLMAGNERKTYLFKKNKTDK